MEMLNEIFRLCIVPLLGILSVYLINFLKKKADEIKASTEIEIADKYIDMLVRIVETCVIATNQTYVNALKDKDAFDAEAQKTAFEMTYNAVKEILSAEMGEVLSEAVGDLDLYIRQLIEENVNYQKRF